MELTCEREDIFELLGYVLSVIPARSTHPVLSNVLLVAEDESLLIYGTDLDISMSGRAKADVAEKGALALPAKRLYELLRELNVGEVFIKSDSKRAVIEQGSGRFTISGVERADYPEEEMLKSEDYKLSLSVDDMRRTLSQTSYAVSADVARIALSGLLIKLGERELTTVATDGHRLTMLKKEIEDGISEHKEILVPAKTAGQLSKILTDAEGDIEIVVAPGMARFTVGRYTLTTKLITERFPDYTQVIPKENDRILIADKDILVAAIKRASVLSNHLTHLIKFNVKEGKAELSCSDYDIGGESFEEIPVEYSNEPMTIGFNSIYFLEVLRHIGSDEVKILMKNALSASLIVPLPQMEKEEYLSILMPLRLPEEEV